MSLIEQPSNFIQQTISLSFYRWKSWSMGSKWLLKDRPSVIGHTNRSAHGLHPVFLTKLKIIIDLLVSFRIMDFYLQKTLHPVYNCNTAKIFYAPLFPSPHEVMGRLYLLFVNDRTLLSSTQQQAELNRSKGFGSVLKVTFYSRGEN